MALRHAAPPRSASSWTTSAAGSATRTATIYTVAHDGKVPGQLPAARRREVHRRRRLLDLRRAATTARSTTSAARCPGVAYEIADGRRHLLAGHPRRRAGRLRRGAAGSPSIDHEDEFQWARKGGATRPGWSAATTTAVYHGHSSGVARYDAATAQRSVAQPSTAACCSAGRSPIRSTPAPARARSCTGFARRTAPPRRVYRCDAAVFSCATAAGRPVRLRRRQPFLGLLLRPGRRAPVEAGHRLRLGLLHAVPRRPPLHRDHRRHPGLHRRQRGGDQGGPGGHRSRGDGRQGGGRLAVVEPTAVLETV